jgi:hypothetical protein
MLTQITDGLIVGFLIWESIVLAVSHAEKNDSVSAFVVSFLICAMAGIYIMISMHRKEAK